METARRIRQENRKKEEEKTPFLGRTHFCTTNLGIWYFFGQAILYSLRSPGNQHYQTVIYSLIFSPKKCRGIKGQ